MRAASGSETLVNIKTCAAHMAPEITNVECGLGVLMAMWLAFLVYLLDF